MTYLIDRDDLLTLSEAARRLPGRPHRSTLWRWARKGIGLPDGGRAYLRVHRLGRRVLIAPEDIEAFAATLANAYQTHDEHYDEQSRRPRTRRDSRRTSRTERAEREADALGL